MGWQCDDCGTVSTSPPCDECGHDTGEYTGFVWVCENCDRQSTKNNPPCPRCGSMELAKRRPDYGDLDDETAVPGYGQLAKPLLPVVAVVLVVVALFATGIVPLPEDLAVALDGPGVSDAPGSADEAAGLNLSDVEAGILDRVDGFRADRGNGNLARDDSVAAMATFDNQRRVVADYDGGSTRGGLRDFSPPCRVAIYRFGSLDGEQGATIDEFETESAVADALFSILAEGDSEAQLDTATEAHGVDVHVAPDGRLYAVYAVC